MDCGVFVTEWIFASRDPGDEGGPKFPACPIIVPYRNLPGARKQRVNSKGAPLCLLAR